MWNRDVGLWHVMAIVHNDGQKFLFLCTDSMLFSIMFHGCFRVLEIPRVFHHGDEWLRSTRHLRTLKASHLRTLQTSHPRTEKPRHPRTKSGHPRTLMLGTSHFGFGWGGGVGWDDNVHVPMHTPAQQPHHLSCCWEETGTALSWSVTGGVGWVNKVHVPMPAHAQQPHHLSCCRALTRTALSWSITLGGVGWGGVGGVGW